MVNRSRKHIRPLPLDMAKNNTRVCVVQLNGFYRGCTLRLVGLTSDTNYSSSEFNM